MNREFKNALVSRFSIDILGWIAGTLTTIAFFPQLLKTWTTKSAKDVSLVMMVTFCIGVFLWLLYGLTINAMPVVVTNSVTLILALLILILNVSRKSLPSTDGFSPAIGENERL